MINPLNASGSSPTLFIRTSSASSLTSAPLSLVTLSNQSPGGGSLSITAPNTSLTPKPDFAEMCIWASAGIFRVDVMAAETTSGCACGRSILFRHGMMDRPCAEAERSTARLCACSPSILTTISISASSNLSNALMAARAYDSHRPITNIPHMPPSSSKPRN